MEDNVKYHAEHVAPLLEPMIAQLLIEKPDDVLSFMVDWLKKETNKKKRAGSEDENSEDEVCLHISLVGRRRSSSYSSSKEANCKQMQKRHQCRGIW